MRGNSVEASSVCPQLARANFLECNKEQDLILVGGESKKGLGCLVALSFDQQLKLESYLEIEGACNNISKIRLLHANQNVIIFAAERLVGLVEIVRNQAGRVQLREIK